MHILEIKQLNKFYHITKQEDFQALKNVNLAFDGGEIVSIVGESGSGKSTLMNVIGGLDLDFQGELSIEGKNLRTLSRKEIDKYRKNKVGFVFQSFNLIPHLSVLDNVTIAMTLSNVSKKQRVARATEILTQVGLKDHMKKRPNQLSGGQKQRVAIARALINDPEIILADEPTGALDSKTSAQVMDILVDIAKQGKLVIVVTHSDKVAASGTRVVRIGDGEITAQERLAPAYETTKTTQQVAKEKQNLSLFSAIKLAFHNMKQKLGRNILVAIGASIGIMSVITMLAIGQGVKNYFTDQMLSNVNPLVVEVSKGNIKEAIEETTHSDNPSPQSPFKSIRQPEPFTKKDKETLSALENVKETAPGFTERGNAQNKLIYKGKNKDGEEEEKDAAVLFYGTLSPEIMDNQFTGTRPVKDEILISEELLAELELDKEAAIGKKMTFAIVVDGNKIEKTVKISGVLEGDAGQMTNLLIPYPDLEAMYKQEDLTLEPTSYYLVAHEESQVPSIRDAVKEAGYSSSFKEQMVDMFQEMLGVTTTVLAAIAAISLFVSAIMIMVVLYISVVERTMEIGVLKAIGARVKDIKRIFLAEAFLTGLFGGLFGLAEAFGLSKVINILSIKQFDVIFSVIRPEYLAFGLLVSIVISMLSGVLPAGKAAKLDPIESLRHE